jgi:cardiolipin synthase (CMP-forming)
MINLPNVLTIIRILLVPVFVNMIIYGRYDYALVVFCVAAFTDALDGMIARLANQHTPLGVYLDPLADKVLLTSAFVTLSIFQHVPTWLTTIVVSRDLILASGTLLLHLLNMAINVTPMWLGKLTTVVQLGYVVAVVAMIAFSWPDVWLFPAVLAVAGVTILSGLAYIYRSVRTMRPELPSHP